MRYASINTFDIVDSITGINISFWTQGCPFHCKNCHNPQTWDFNGGEELPSDYVDKIIKLFNEENNKDKGLSILGGEPLYGDNIQITYDLIKGIKETFPNKIIYLWSGYTYKQLKKMKDNRIKCILNSVDYFIDGLFDETKIGLDLILRGSSNQNVYQRIGKKLKKIY